MIKQSDQKQLEVYLAYTCNIKYGKYLKYIVAKVKKARGCLNSLLNTEPDSYGKWTFNKGATEINEGMNSVLDGFFFNSMLYM